MRKRNSKFPGILKRVVVSEDRISKKMLEARLEAKQQRQRVKRIDFEPVRVIYSRDDEVVPAKATL